MRSRAAYLIAMRDGIRSRLNRYTYKNCALTFDHKPHPRCGEVFVSVHSGSRNSMSDLALYEEIEICITLTMRWGQVPFDRLGDDLLCKEGTGMFDRLDELRAFAHLSYDVMNSCNAKLGPNVNGFITPVRYLGESPPTTVGPDHFHASPESTECGTMVTLRFGKPEQIQVIEEMQ